VILEKYTRQLGLIEIEKLYLKRIYNSSDKIVDILKEVKFIININVDLRNSV